ncbi:TRAP transporter small permease [Variovorax sp.]|uniref:TRAP transporter small permease n=1 Tax=Variovorax sp. TaxID=1871043 RepID=UPI002D61A35F|nr:TRAP transporter small permease [Variovorax sp.]HYP85874.1 TRAP transporter small permease [Variovorax sp.]
MRWLHRLEEGVIAFLLAAMTLVTFGQVVARYGFNYSFTWALELNTVFFAWLIFVGMSYGVRVGAHIGVDLLVRRLGPRNARVVAAAACALCLAYALILTWGGIVYLQKMYAVGILMQDIPVPQWIPRIVLPLGFALLTLRFAELMWRVLRGQATTLLGDEAQDALKLRTDTPGAADAPEARP